MSTVGDTVGLKTKRREMT